MGWFDGVSEVGSSSSHHHHHKSSSGKHHSSDKEKGSIFGSGSPKHNRSTSSFFGITPTPENIYTYRYANAYDYQDGPQPAPEVVPPLTISVLPEKAT
jgi:hypothetical protein